MDFGVINKLKKTLIGIIVVVLIIGGYIPCFAIHEPKGFTFSGGEGTEDNPFLISNLEYLLEAL